MPSKKQRRRREKLKRHEWEFVRLDEEGNEVPVEAARPKKASANGKTKSGTQRSRRPLREVKPPSWNRAAKRSLVFVPVLYVFLSLGKNAPAWYTRVAVSILYAVVFIPMFFYVDRLTYRAYKRRLGEDSS